MGDQISNAQALSSGIAQGFGDAMSEEDARKKKAREDGVAAKASAANQMQAQQSVTGQEPSAWETLQSMGRDIVSGASDMASTAAEKLGLKKKK